MRFSVLLIVAMTATLSESKTNGWNHMESKSDKKSKSSKGSFHDESKSSKSRKSGK
jgi:hypothetical protein